MKQTRCYEFEGLILEIPLQYDERSGLYIEDYPDFVENPVWTPQGHQVMFSGEEACDFAEEAAPGGCSDCGSCRFYRMVGTHTWIGVCGHEKRKNIQDGQHFNTAK